MLAEDFVGNMENGGEFGGGRLEWDMKSNSWEWENVMMYPGRLDVGRKPHGSDWGEEPVVVSGSISSGIPGIAATSSSSGLASVCGSLQRVYPERNSSDSKALGGLPSQVKPEADDHGGKEQNAPCLDLATRSGNDKADKKVNGVMSGVEKQSSVANLSANQQKKHFLGLGGGAHEKEDLAKEGGKQAANGNHDAEIGLKLGKRTYFEDTSVATASKTPAASPPGKKSRGSAANHAPRCQVEGCKTDLSSAKDYHRRHKVCAMHSKSAKVCVNTIEQRFCQQCSRFHVLSEFDEGKRSCRRRLAGHNERRRKPQPDPMALASAAVTQADLMRRAIGLSRGDDRLLGYGLGPSLSFLGLDDVHNKLNYSKGGNWPRFGNLDDHTGLVPGLSNLPRSAERLLMFLPHRKGPLLNGIGGHSVHQFMQGSGSMGQNLSLSSSAGTGLYTGLGSSQASQGVTGVSDSGRALSLLSSQSWAASTQDSMPLDMSQKSNLALEQLISENRAPYSQQTYSGSSPVRQQHYAPSAEKLLSHPGQGSITGGQSQGGAFLPSMGVNNYENHSVLTLLQESELRGLQNQHARPTIDLMQMSNHHQQQHAHSPAQAVAMQQQQPSSGHLADFQVLKPYGSTMYDPQEL